MAAAEETTTQTGSLSPSETKPPVSKARKITPIVFWASCKPWPSAIAAAERVCAPRKPRLVRDGFRRRNPHMIASITRNAKPKPTNGDSTIGMTTLSRITDQCTTLPEAMAAPTSPPMRACEDDEGSPKYQVIRFQAVAPSRPPMTMTMPWIADPPGTMTSATVLATSCPRNAPIRFMTAAIARAIRGVRARVDTEVAMAFAASWKPLVKSKPSAITTRAMMTASSTGRSDLLLSLKSAGSHAFTEPGVVALVLIGVQLGVGRHGVRKGVVLTEVRGDRHRIARASVGPSQGPAAQLAVGGHAGRHHPLDRGGTLHVLELADVEVPVLAVDPLGSLPPEEDVAGGLHEPLPRDDPLPLVAGRLTLHHRRRDMRLQHRGPGLLHLQQQRIVLVPTLEQCDPAAGPDAADAHDLAGEIDEGEPVEQHTSVRLEAASEVGQDPRHLLLELLALGAGEQLLNRHDER